MLRESNSSCCPQVEISRKAKTVTTYSGWLTPFINWLEAKLATRPFPITSRTVSDYLVIVRKYKSSKTYQRVGAQIVEFLNRFLHEKVHLIKGLGFKLKYDNINMPKESVAPIGT